MNSTSGLGGMGRFFRMPSVAERLVALEVRSDVAAVAANMAASRRSDTSAKYIGLYLPESELVVAMIEARHAKSRGTAVLTNRRLLFFGYDTRGGPSAELPLASLSAADVSSVGTAFQARCATGVLDVDQALGRSAQIFADAVRRQLAGPADPATAPFRDPIQALAEVRALHDAGVMSDHEYAVEKARLMDQI